MTADQPFDWRAHVRVHPAADLLPLLPPDELRTLADDMAANGMLSFAVADKDGNLLDGRNRLDALALLGALEAAPDGGVRFKAGGDPIRWRILGDGDPYDQVLSLNIHRRHLTAEQKRDLIAKLLKAKPAASNNSIAKQVKVDDKTVGTVRRELERRSEIPNVKARTDSKGRKQPANKSKPKKAEATTRPKAGPEVPGILEEYSSAIEAGCRTGKYVILYRAVFGPFDSEEEAQRWAQARYPHAGRWDDKEEETEPEPPAVVQPTPSVNGNDIDSGESAKAMKAAHAAQENDGLDIPECLRR